MEYYKALNDGTEYAHEIAWNLEDISAENTKLQAVKDMLQQYKVDNSTVLSWFRDIHNEDINKLKGLKVGTAYVSYCKWCEEAGRSRSSLTTLKNSIKSDLGVDLSD